MSCSLCLCFCGGRARERYTCTRMVSLAVISSSAHRASLGYLFKHPRITSRSPHFSENQATISSSTTHLPHYVHHAPFVARHHSCKHLRCIRNPISASKRETPVIVAPATGAVINPGQSSSCINTSRTTASRVTATM